VKPLSVRDKSPSVKSKLSRSCKVSKIPTEKQSSDRRRDLPPSFGLQAIEHGIGIATLAGLTVVSMGTNTQKIDTQLRMNPAGAAYLARQDTAAS
jgi:hypothetical protein